MEQISKQLGVGTISLSEKERQYVNEVMNSDRLSYGPFSRRFEHDFAKMHDSNFSVFVNSGTSALTLAVACLAEVYGWKPGDEIIVPALTFVATANVVIEQGFVPVFVDVNERTYNINSSLIEEKITSRTKAIIPVHLFGQVADMDPILELAKKYDLRIIEDSCETVGVTYKGRKAGSFGDISCFSTYIAHLVVTGVGGLAVTSNKEYAEVIRSLANHGRDGIYTNIDDDKDIDGVKFGQVIKRRFNFVRHGYSFRSTEMEAALGVGQLERLEEILSSRQRNAEYLINKMSLFDSFIQLPWYDQENFEHAFMMFPIVIHKDAEFTKEELTIYLEEWNVETRDMVPLINQPVYKDLKIDQKAYPVSDWVNTNGFYIGCHQGLDEDNLDYIYNVFQQFFSERELYSI